MGHPNYHHWSKVRLCLRFKEKTCGTESQSLSQLTPACRAKNSSMDVLPAYGAWALKLSEEGRMATWLFLAPYPEAPEIESVASGSATVCHRFCFFGFF